VPARKETDRTRSRRDARVIKATCELKIADDGRSIRPRRDESVAENRLTTSASPSSGLASRVIGGQNRPVDVAMPMTASD